MSEPLPPDYNLLCSACYTPCPAAEAHVIPWWNPERRQVFTTYRCSNCWLPSLDELRAAVTSGDADVHASFCDFLARHGYAKDADTLRGYSASQRQGSLLSVINAVQSGVLVFDP